MVRFGWHVEDGLGAHILPGEMTLHDSTQISHATCSIELAEDSQPLQAIFTLPSNYLQHDQVHQVGVALAHGDMASEWTGHLLTELALALAAQGFLVVRYHCDSAEDKLRQRMYEKALDAVATSPYAASVEGWVLAGVGSGARVAAAVARRCRGSIVGCVFLSYPLQEPPSATAQTAGIGATPVTESAGLLLGLQQPMLFVKGEADEQCPTGLLAQLLLSGHMSCKDARLLVVPDVDQHFTAGKCGTPAPVLQQVAAAVTQFVEAVDSGTLDRCLLLRPSQQEAAMAPPGSLSSHHPLQPSSTPHHPLPSEAAVLNVASGAAASMQSAQQSWQQPQQWQQRSDGNASLPVTLQQASLGWRAAPDAAARAHTQPQIPQPVPHTGNGLQAAGWQQRRDDDSNAIAPLQLGGPAAHQREVSNNAVQHSGSPDGRPADAAAAGATASGQTDVSSSEYDSGDEGQQPPAQQGLQQPPMPLQSALHLQPRTEHPSLHAGLDGPVQRNPVLPTMQQMAAAAQRHPEQPDAQALLFGQHHGGVAMPKAQRPSLQHQPPTQLWQQQAAPAIQDLSTGRAGLQLPEATLQQQMAAPAALAPVGHVPLEQLWGQGAASGNMLAAFMAGHHNAPRPDFTSR